MTRLTSYQRRLRNIEFYKQRGQDLEGIIHALCCQIAALGHRPKVPLGKVMGDQILNDVSSGEFGMELSMKYIPQVKR